MKLECMSLVCRMVKVFFPSAAADSAPGRQIVAPTAAEPARNSRRESASHDTGEYSCRGFRPSCPFAVSTGPHPPRDGCGPVGRVSGSVNVGVTCCHRAFPQLLHHFIEVEAGGLLPLRILLEGHQELAHVILRGHENEGVIEHPVVVGVRCDVRPLVGIEPQVEDLGNAQGHERLGPDSQRSLRPAVP